MSKKPDIDMGSLPEDPFLGTDQLHPRIQEFIRKPFVAFLRLETPEHCTAVAQFFLNSTKVTHEYFKETVGINLLDHIGCYMECGAAINVVGPTLPGPIKPVLRFKLTRRGHWLPQMLEVNGIYHSSLKHAWIKTDLWEQVVEDSDYFEKVFLGGKKKKDAKKRKK